MKDKDQFFLPYALLQVLITTLQQAGYQCIGPKAKEGVIVYEPLTEASQLPWGIYDEQNPGEYRLKQTQDKKAFAWTNGAQGIKPLLFKPKETVWKVARNAAGKLEFLAQEALDQPIAFFGARACDLAAMAIQDKVFMNGSHPDPRYQSRRLNLFIIGVNCSNSSSNCFCVSAGTGPEIKAHYDLLLTEIDQGFTIKTGSEKGLLILNQLALKHSKTAQNKKAESQIQNAAQMQTKRIPKDNSYALRDLLFANLDHPRWDDVAERCLSCGNCTQVCPTCFCHTETEHPALDGQESQHQVEWDSCFSAGHSFVSGKVLRDSTNKRYRQWLTHKVGSWFDQFDSSGCVGCGRCISWCPVGIDLTEELAAITGESNRKGEIGDV